MNAGGTRSQVVAAEAAMRCPICLDSMVEPVVTECGHRFCRKCIYCALRQLKRECPVCRRFIASHRVLKPWVEDGRSTHDLKETVSTSIIEDGWICSTCTLQNSMSEVRCIACSGRRATNLSKRGRPLLSPGMTCADGSSTTSGISSQCAQPRGHGGKAARVPQPAVKESPLAPGISVASEGVCGEQGCVGAASAALAQGVDGDDIVNGIAVVELAAMIPSEGYTSTGYRGVQRRTSQTLPFQARIWENGRFVNLGRFKTAEEASRVYTAHLAKKMEARRASQVAPTRVISAAPTAHATSAGAASSRYVPPAHAASQAPARKRKRCEHGRQHSACKECGGSDICEHGRQPCLCKECGGGSICAHGRRRYYCKECGGKGICEHGRERHYCKECGGKGICEHGRERRNCKECGGERICEHGRWRNRCKKCGGASICEHGRMRIQCKECGGSSICEHGRQRSLCKECGGAGICEHGQRRHRCKECGGCPNHEPTDMKVLRQRLKVNAKTKPATLAAAAALARDSSLDEAKLFDVHKVARGRAQVHAKALAARIVRESLLDPASASSSA